MSLESGAEMLTIAQENLEKSTSWKEVETALAMVIEAVDGRVIGYDDAQHFVEQAKYRSRFIPTTGVIATPETKPVQGEWLFIEQIVGHALHVPNADADFLSVYFKIE